MTMFPITAQRFAEFARTEDYAFVLNAGFQCANDRQTREEIASMIEKSDLIEFSWHADLEDEENNGSIVYKVTGTQIPDLHIAYYEP